MGKLGWQATSGATLLVPYSARNSHHWETLVDVSTPSPLFASVDFVSLGEPSWQGAWCGWVDGLWAGCGEEEEGWERARGRGMGHGQGAAASMWRRRRAGHPAACPLILPVPEKGVLGGVSTPMGPPPVPDWKAQGKATRVFGPGRLSVPGAL